MTRNSPDDPFNKRQAAGYVTRSGRSRPFQKKKALLIFCLALIALVLSVVAYFAISRLGTPGISFTGEVGFPGEAHDEMGTTPSEASDNMKIGLSSRLMVDGLLAEYCKIPGDMVKKKLVVSGRFLFSDQIELLSFYAEQGDKRGFYDLYQRIGSRFKGSDGLYTIDTGIPSDAASDAADGSDTGNAGNSGTSEDSPVSVSSNIRYCRVLLEGYARFSDRKYLKSAAELSELLYPLCRTSGIPPADITIILSGDTPTPDFSATPTPRPTALPSDNPDIITSIKAIDISSIDLYALKLLGSLDPKWDSVYAESLRVVQGASISYPVPLFQAGYYPDTKGYAPYLGASPEFDFDRQLMTALHLAEVGELGESTYAFLRQELMNSRAFFRTYNILTAAAVSPAESVTGYACMARLARISNDPVVYEFCVGRIFWNSADSYTSKIFGLTFFEAEDRTVWSFAKETILSLKALY